MFFWIKRSRLETQLSLQSGAGHHMALVESMSACGFGRRWFHDDDETCWFCSETFVYLQITKHWYVGHIMFRCWVIFFFSTTLYFHICSILSQLLLLHFWIHQQNMIRMFSHPLLICLSLCLFSAFPSFCNIRLPFQISFQTYLPGCADIIQANMHICTGFLCVFYSGCPETI